MKKNQPAPLNPRSPAAQLHDQQKKPNPHHKPKHRAGDGTFKSPPSYGNQPGDAELDTCDNPLPSGPLEDDGTR